MLVLIVAVNAVLILLAVGIASRILPAKVFSGAVAVLHKMVGITLPTPDKERIVAVIWIGSTIVIGDGILFLLILLTRVVFKG